MTKEKAIEEEMTMAGLSGQLNATITISITKSKKNARPHLRRNRKYNQVIKNDREIYPELFFTVTITGSALGMRYKREFPMIEPQYINNVIADSKTQFASAVKNYYDGLRLVKQLPKVISEPVTIALDDKLNFYGSPGAIVGL